MKVKFLLSPLFYTLSLLLMSTGLVAQPYSGSTGVQSYLGPEIYYVERQKEGGMKQTGVLYGIRAGYERLKRYKFYYALDGLYSSGNLEGKKDDRHLKTRFTNANLETRFGYTFEMKWFPYFSFTPYFGAGKMWEINDFVHPSPIPLHTENNYIYIPFGFQTSLFIHSHLSLGVNLKGRYLLQGKQKVSNDPDYKTMWQCYQDYIQYRLEIPINYFFQYSNSIFSAKLTPFYEFRHYGTRANYPFDYIDTQYSFYGASFEIVYIF